MVPHGGGWSLGLGGKLGSKKNAQRGAGQNVSMSETRRTLVFDCWYAAEVGLDQWMKSPPFTERFTPVT